jgi:hypothetical protein
MRRIRTAALGLLLAASFALAADPKDCLLLSARQDSDIQSPSGVRVTVNGHNRCAEDLDGNACRFKVSALGPGGVVIATQSGRFGGTVEPHGRIETKVFVLCDPDRVRSLSVEPE